MDRSVPDWGTLALLVAIGSQIVRLSLQMPLNLLTRKTGLENCRHDLVAFGR